MLALCLTGCLLGEDPFKGLPNRPALVGQPVLLAPTVADQGALPFATVGVEVAVELETGLAIDPSATSVTLDGAPMDCRALASTRLRCARAMDGTEGNGLKVLSGTLVDPLGGSARFTTAPVVVTDFIPPTAACVLSPTVANGAQRVTLAITASEALRPGSLQVTADDPSLVVVPSVDDASGLLFDLLPAPDTNYEPYQLTVAATDLAGNAQVGPSLCASAQTTGWILGVGPSLVGDVVVTADPHVDVDDLATVTVGATVWVSLPTDATLDEVVSRVTLSGTELAPAGPGLWSRTLDGTEGDGVRDLDARLVDTAGNELTVQAPRLIRFDFTAPEVASAVLSRAPFLASADPGTGRVVFAPTDPISGAATRGALRVAATEDLGGPAALSVEGPAPLDWEVEQAAARLTSWSLGAVPDGPDGDHTFRVVLTDLVGNASQPLPLDVTFELDSTAPTTGLDVDRHDLITYDRAPWGEASGAASSYVVSGASGAAPAGGLVTLENAAGGLLASGLAAADGAFTLALGSDLPDVYVRAHDSAGNRGPAVRVRDVSWTATLAGKVVGSTAENPHTFRAFGALDAERPPRVEGGEEFAAATVRTEREASWVRRSAGSGESPPLRLVHAMAYDASRGRVVMYGGLGNADDRLRDTWEWDGRGWARAESATSPAATVNHAMVYDAVRGVTVLFGGVSGSNTVLDETWEWDGERWTKRAPAHAPPPRHSQAMAYDAQRGVTVLFGGLDELGNPLGDTWEWDGVDWSERRPPTSPVGRYAHAMAYDVDRGVTVLYGGVAFDLRADTWEWDGAVWRRRVVPAPPARAGHVMAYDGARGVMTLYGGQTADGTFASDTWLWDGHVWSSPPVEGPQARAYGQLVYDEERRELVLFGGQMEGVSFALPGTYSWDGEGWSLADGRASTPQARFGHAAAWDPASETVVLFGGQSGPYAPYLSYDDTWTWTGGSWATQAPDVRPEGLSYATLAQDPFGLVLFGGEDANHRESSGTWGWYGWWWEQAPVSSPPAQVGHAMAYDATRAVTVLFGGASSRDPQVGATWEWDGLDWVELEPAAAPPSRTSHALAYDARRGVVVMFGGSSGGGANYLSDTWEWDGVTWKERTPTASPPGRWGHSMAYDAARGEVVVFGGLTQQGNTQLRLNDTWVWDGVRWAERVGDEAPPARYASAMAYDSTRGEMLLFGGLGASILGDTWTLPSVSSGRPRHQLDVAFDAAHASDASIRSVTARWRAGGSGDPGQGPVAGVELTVWDGRRWTMLDANSADDGAPDVLCAHVVVDASEPAEPDCSELQAPDLLPRLFQLGRDRTSTFAVRPVAPIGAGRGALVSEDVLVRVRYRLPASPM